MRCPLTNIIWIDGCDNECGWYDEKNKCCVMLSIAKKLSQLKVSVAR